MKRVGGLLLALALGGATGPGFAPPAGALRLTRELHRHLADGQQVVTRRSYRIRITRTGTASVAGPDAGFVVDGVLVSAEVSAPPALAQLAAIERARPDTGLFPLHLDRDGQITDAAAPPDTATGKALKKVTNEMISGAHLGPARRAEMRRFTLAVLQGDGSEMPAELLHPQPGHVEDTSQFALPDGGKGQITVAIDAETDPATGLMRRFSRAITTSGGGTARASEEVWTLLPD